MKSWLRSLFSSAPQATHRPVRRMLEVERLESRTVPAGVLAIGSGTGVAPQVALFHDTNNDGVPDGAAYATFPVLAPAFRGGVRVAVGNFVGNSNLEVAVAAGPGGAPLVQIFQLNGADVPTGASDTFLAAGSGFTHGLFITRYNFTGTGLDSLVVAADAGGAPFVKIYNDTRGVALDQHLGNSLADAFLAFGSSYHGGVRPAAGRNLAAAGGDFLALATGPGITARIMILKDSNNNLALSDNLGTREVILPFGSSWQGGLFVAMGDAGSPSTNPEIIVSRDTGASPRVLIFSDTNLNNRFGDDGGPASSFLAYNAGFTGGVRVAYTRLSSANVGQSGEVLVAPGSTARPVRIFKTTTNTGEILNGEPPLAQFFPLGASFTHGYFASFAGNGV